ncbi:3'-5' exonuclease [Candidatus Woesearchaeota archaeon]|nr:3'-5' exonuclease [Candidatus Woesearchaeota archaeon]MCF7901244.1 3'-5' exonuclease [Candidatus Woesearchaeota archaeon]MCF8012849.1 3'-5' exonuclease [Candidatus Woesearchaeota archaeon]
MLNEYTVLDIETTGLSRYRHKITEIAAVNIVDGIVKKEFQTLINPETKIPRFITRLTGINDEMVKDAPTINEAMPKFLNFLDESVMIAHNASFDYGFLKYNTEELIGKKFENQKLCTRKLASRLIPELPSKKLSCVCEHYNIINEDAHRAMTDVKATFEVFKKFHETLLEAGIKEREEILKFESLPGHKCRQILYEKLN